MTEDFGVESVLASAREATRLDDFGDPHFREGLGVLLETYATTANLNEKGRRRFRRRVVQLLVQRLKIEDAFKRHPEIREQQIRRPMYLTGLPRTGTSALFNLLGMDPAARPLLLWEAIFPDPLDDLEPGQTDPRLKAMREHYARGRQKNDEFTKIHYTDADLPEECVLLLAHTFCDVQMGIEPLMEPYSSWFYGQDLRPSYAYYHELLKMLQWQRPGDRWLLKSPAHLFALDILVEQFPDACIVVTHRDPLQILPSYCSMMEALMAGREDFDRSELGRAVLEFCALALERGVAAREASDPKRFVDVDYRDFTADSMGTVERIYGHFGLDLPAASERTMRDHVASHPKGKHGAHEYSLAQYGLTPEMVTERLGRYVERFDRPVSGG